MRWELAVKYLKSLYLLFFSKMVTPTPPRPPQTSRFSLPSFVIRGFLSSEHGGRRAKPLFSIVWYSLQTGREAGTPSCLSAKSCCDALFIRKSLSKLGKEMATFGYARVS